MSSFIKNDRGALLDGLLEHIIERGPMTVMLEATGPGLAEIMCHTEWTPRDGDPSNGNATGFGVSDIDALGEMLVAVERGQVGSALPAEVKESPQYVASTTWGNHVEPGSHASQQRDFSSPTHAHHRYSVHEPNWHEPNCPAREDENIPCTCP